MRITKLECDNLFPESAVKALRAAAVPFGSLWGEALGRDEIPQLMVEVLATKTGAPEEYARAVGLLAAALRRTDADQSSEMRLGMWDVTLVTPTSQTKIHLSRGAGPASYRVEVDFGADGSDSRADEILGAAWGEHYYFRAHTAERELTGAEVRERLLERATSHLEWIEGLEPGYYPEPNRGQMVTEARARVAELEWA